MLAYLIKISISFISEATFYVIIMNSLCLVKLEHVIKSCKHTKYTIL